MIRFLLRVFLPIFCLFLLLKTKIIKISIFVVIITNYKREKRANKAKMISDFDVLFNIFNLKTTSRAALLCTSLDYVKTKKTVLWFCERALLPDCIKARKAFLTITVGRLTLELITGFTPTFSLCIKMKGRVFQRAYIWCFCASRYQTWQSSELRWWKV